jgi:hypothetical protein
MISALAIISRNGDIVTFRKYRNDFDFHSFENYRISIISAKEVNLPINFIDNISFLNHYENEVYYVGMTRFNPNGGTIFEILSKIPQLIKSVLQFYPSPNNIKRNIPSNIKR